VPNFTGETEREHFLLPFSNSKISSQLDNDPADTDVASRQKVLQKAANRHESRHVPIRFQSCMVKE